MTRRRVGAFGPLAALVLLSVASNAETAWVKDELSLNVRTGPGVQYRIKGTIKTGDSVTVINRREDWTEVRAGEIGTGWIPEGYLQLDPPATLRLERTEAETAEFRSQFSTLQERMKQLEEENGALTTSDATQREEIETLTRDNLELRAGARWPEWITGACILAAGMLLGAILRSLSARRSRPRIRL